MRNTKWIFGLTIVLLSFVGSSSQKEDDEGPVVHTALGAIQGRMMKSQYGTDIYAFRGIRYAKAPVDELRFAVPVPVEPWTGTLKATLDSLVCPQTGLSQLMSEDCLKLNVFSRNLTGKAPVMVYIHGGANVLGSGSSVYEAGPQYLLDHDVVMVAFNYRLGALGFLSTGSKEAPGNFGYLDQVLVLKWVQAHISKFGGDPNLVTIYGLSAGAMAVTLHLASPLSKGLFHRAIAMSGSATNEFIIDNLFWTRKLAREVSCPMYNPKDVIDCLRSVSWQKIASVCSGWEPYGFTNMKWNYEIDGYFLKHHPTTVFRMGNFNQVPLLVGFTKNELDFSVNHQENNTGLLNDISVSFNSYAPELFLYNGFPYNGDPYISERIQDFYFGNQTDINSDNLQSFGQIFSDGIIISGVQRLVELTHFFVDVFYYRMDYVGRRTLYAVDGTGKPKGVGHADDIQYVMPGLWYGTQLKIDDPDMFMVDRLTKWWTSFAKHGTPTPENEYEWEPSNYRKIVTLYNDKETHMGVQPYEERYLLWDSLFHEMSGSAGNRIKFITICIMIVSPLLTWL